MCGSMFAISHFVLPSKRSQCTREEIRIGKVPLTSFAVSRLPREAERPIWFSNASDVFYSDACFSWSFVCFCKHSASFPDWFAVFYRTVSVCKWMLMMFILLSAFALLIQLDCSPRVWTFFLACPKMWFLSTACVFISKMRAGDLHLGTGEHFFFARVRTPVKGAKNSCQSLLSARYIFLICGPSVV